MKKAGLVLIVTALTSGLCLAQVAGLSASKLGTLNAGPVPYGIIEFEPSVYISMSSKIWNAHGKRISRFSGNDSLAYSSGMNFRFSYGLIDGVETGISVSGNLSSASFGTKIRFIQKESIETGVLAGLNLNGLNQAHSKNDSIADYSHTYSVGFVNTILFSEKLSLDSDVQIQKYFPTGTDHTLDIFVDSDLGYYINENVQIVTGLNYSASFFPEQPNSCLLLANVGFTFEKGSQFILVMNVPFSIYGKNAGAYTGLGFALTLSFE